MTVVFHPAAEAEFDKAIDYYEEREPGLGRDFAVEVHTAVQRALTYPKAWPVLEHEVRRALVQRFPYGVLYVEEPHGIFVLAVMNLHREPGYWKPRL